MMAIKEYWVKTKSFFKECRRVLKVTKKPTGEEFKTIVKVTGAGMLIIGAIGALISITATLLGV